METMTTQQQQRSSNSAAATSIAATAMRTSMCVPDQKKIKKNIKKRLSTLVDSAVRFN